MTFPLGLRVLDHPAADHPAAEGSRPEGSGPPQAGSRHPEPTVVLVHGSLDRADSFRRVVRRLHGLRVVTYDRRGYAGSRGAVPGTGPGAGAGVDLAVHVADLLAVVEAVGTAPVAAVGHSFGGDVVVAGALARPDRFAAIGAYEPPMPWLGFRRPGGGPPGRPEAAVGAAPPWSEVGEPGDESERFFRRMVGDTSWERLPASARADRRADGPALVGDLRVIRGPAPFDVTKLRVPVVFGRGGHRSSPHHREGVAWLAAHVPDGHLFEIEGATHGAHLSHPDHFADLVRAVEALATTSAGFAGGAECEEVARA